VCDANVVPPSVALAAIDQQIEALLSRFGGDSRQGVADFWRSRDSTLP
jgi:hypothetical protein